MDDLTKILLTSAFTIVGGVLVFVIGQLLVKFLIEPLHEFRKVLGFVRFAFDFFAPELHTPVPGDKERCDKASDAFRKASADLASSLNSVPWYDLMSRWFPKVLPPRAKASEAVKWLRNLATAVYKADRSDNHKIVHKLYDLLGFGTPQE